MASEGVTTFDIREQIFVVSWAFIYVTSCLMLHIGGKDAFILPLSIAHLLYFGIHQELHRRFPYCTKIHPTQPRKAVFYCVMLTLLFMCISSIMYALGFTTAMRWHQSIIGVSMSHATFILFISELLNIF